MNPAHLEEFQYFYGDPRLHLFKFLENELGILSISGERFFKNKCNLTLKKEIIPPVIRKKDVHILQDPNNKIVMMPMMLYGKFGCKFEPSLSRHLNLVLYNKVTQELERIDIRKYHIDGFKVKPFIKRIRKYFPEYLNNVKIEFVDELDVSMQFMKQYKYESIRIAYPIYVICYLILRSQNPDKKSIEVEKMVKKLGVRKMQVMWERYVDFCKKLREREDKNCELGYLKIPESSRCARPLSKTMISKIIEKPPKKCKGDKVFNPIENKCTKSFVMKDVDIMFDDILKYNKLDKFVSVDRDTKTIMGILNYWVSKYPYAAFNIPSNSKIDSKSELKMKWGYRKDIDDFEFKLPSMFWETWNEHMQNPRIRFIITLMSLASKSDPQGFHANVLIFDKTNNELERFDGLGRDVHKTYQIEKLDEIIKGMFPNYKYFIPLDYCPNDRIFQAAELDDIPGKELRGNCAVWRMWYIHIRLANPNLNRKEVVELAHFKLKEKGNLYKFIKGYQKFIVDMSKKHQKK